MTLSPLVELTFWNPGDPARPSIDALLVDPTAPLAKHGLTGIAELYASKVGAPIDAEHRRWAEHLNLKSLSVDGSLSEVVPALDGAGVPFFVAKGPAIAYADYPDPRMRPYTDLDVYVPESRVVDARAALADAGFSPVHHALGALGGLAQEVHGGRFNAVVEVHAHPIDNLHRRHLPPVEAFLNHVETAQLCGVKVPVLSPAAHLALQAIHLACGHRYQKLVLLRDVEVLLDLGRTEVLRALDAHPYVAVAAAMLGSFGRPNGHGAMPGVVHRSTVRSLTRLDPAMWDEYRLSSANILSLLNQPTWLTALRCAVAASRSLVPSGDRRVSLRRPATNDTSPEPTRSTAP